MHNTPHIIGLTGLAGAGKDTVADVLATHCGFTKLAFADALRAEIEAAYQLVPGSGALTMRATKEQPTQRLALCECNDLAFVGAVAIAQAATVSSAWMREPRSPRQVMQWWGTEYRRRQNVTYWTGKLTAHIKGLQRVDGRTRFVVADCRFENEAAALRAMGGQVWQVDRPGLLQNPATAERAHASETTGDKLLPEIIVSNDTTLDGLRALVLGYWWATEARLKTVRVEVLQ